MSLNNYRILHKVGQGQYGVVYKGIRKSDGVPVALKVCSMKFDAKVTTLSLSNKKSLLIRFKC